MQDRTLRPRALVAPAALAALALPLVLVEAEASSHREAPFVTEHPKVDATDFYLFNSYEPGREDFVVLVANYLPLQDPYGGPNYFAMDREARYEIHVDNDGDAVEDISFRFRFFQELADIALPIGPPGAEIPVSVPLRFIGPIDATNDAALNDKESFAVSVVRDGATIIGRLRDAATGESLFKKPLDNVGEKTIADYAGYADAFEYDVLLPGGFQGRVFVGQRKDPFVVNLGETFDLVNTNPLGPEDGEEDTLADKNVTSLILELPKAFLLEPGQPVIGAWTSASLPRDRALLTDPSYDQPAQESGPFVQVSRLSSPLVNEVVIGLKDKDRFNASHPSADAQFLDYVTHPTMPAILEALFGVQAPNLFPRDDLVQAFLTGVPGLNDNGAVGEMLRLNTAVPAAPAAAQERLGLIAGDLAGFPNGRRPGDDVVDIELRALMGVLLPLSLAPDGQLPYTDGAFLDASFFDDAFPFLRDPLPGSPQ